MVCSSCSILQSVTVDGGVCWGFLLVWSVSVEGSSCRVRLASAGLWRRVSVNAAGVWLLYVFFRRRWRADHPRCAQFCCQHTAFTYHNEPLAYMTSRWEGRPPPPSHLLVIYARRTCLKAVAEVTCRWNGRLTDWQSQPARWHVERFELVTRFWQVYDVEMWHELKISVICIASRRIWVRVKFGLLSTTNFKEDKFWTCHRQYVQTLDKDK